MKVQVLAAVLALFGAPMAAQATPPPAGRTIDDSDRVICRVTRPVGSRLGGTRTCRTAAEWAVAQAEARSTVNRIQNQGASICSPNPNPNGPPAC